MKRLTLLIFLSTINLFSCNYTMEIFKKNHVTLITTSPKHLFTSKPELMELHTEDATHALHFGMDNEKKIQYIKAFKPHDYKCFLCKPPVFEKKEIRRLQKLLHKPSLLDELTEEEYYKALSLAEKFKVPFLYTTLLHTQLPPYVLTLITQKYLCLHDLPNAMREKLCSKEIDYFRNKYKDTLAEITLFRKTYGDTFFSFKEEKIRDKYISWLNDLNNDLDTMCNTITLPQALFLSLLCNQPKNSITIMTLRPSTVGFKECKSLLSNNETFMATLYNHQLITADHELSQKNNDLLVAFHFKV